MKAQIHAKTNHFETILELLASLVIVVLAVVNKDEISLERFTPPAHFQLLEFADAKELRGISVAEVSGVINLMVKQSLKGPQSVSSQKIAAAIIDESAAVGLDPILVVAIIQHESRFNSRTVGRHGEIGLMQILPSTALWIGKKVGAELNSAEDLYDPVLNIKIGVRYLAWLKQKYTDIRHAITAFNMGPANVRLILANGRVPKIYFEKVLFEYREILNFLSHYTPAQAKDERLVSFNN